MVTRLTRAALASAAVLILSMIGASPGTMADADNVLPSSILHGSFHPYLFDKNCGSEYVELIAIATNHIDPIFVTAVNIASSCHTALVRISNGQVRILAPDIPAKGPAIVPAVGPTPAAMPASDGSYWWLEDTHYLNIVPGEKTAIIRSFVAGYAPVALSADGAGDVYSIEVPKNRNAPLTPEFVNLQTGKHFRMPPAATVPGPFLSSADGHAYFTLAGPAGTVLYKATRDGPQKIAWFRNFRTGDFNEKAIASDGSIWSAWPYGVVRNDKLGRTVQSVYPIAPRPKIYGNPSWEFTHGLAPSRDGTLWFIFKGSLWRLRPNGALEHADLPYPSESFPRLFAADDGSVWITGAQVDGRSALLQFRPKN